MEIFIIALVCSQLGVPDHTNCMVDTATHQERLELTVSSVVSCQRSGMFAAADLVAQGKWKVDPATEYVKVMCVLPSVKEYNRAG